MGPSVGARSSDVSIANAGAGLSPNLDGSAYPRVRVSFYMPSSLSVTSPGPYLDSMVLRLTYDQ